MDPYLRLFMSNQEFRGYIHKKAGRNNLFNESFEFIMEKMNCAMRQNLRQQFRWYPRILAIIDRNLALRFGETGPDTAAGSQGQDDG